MVSSGSIHQINVNPQGGVPKHAVGQAFLGTQGVRGDKQRDRMVHGGPTRAVSLFALERINALQAEGHPIIPGSTGENLTISGLDWDNIMVGDRLLLGDSVEIEITGYAAPCKNIAESFSDGTFTRMSQKLHPGWSRLYARIIHEGDVKPGMRVALLPRT